jgi:hypothetical protein
MPEALISKVSLNPDERVFELCDYVAAVFDGHMMITEPLQYSRQFTS